MDLAEFVQQGWQDHVKDSPSVMGRLPEGVSLVAKANDLPSLAALIVHVAGEHMGLWDEGLALLARLESLPVFDSASAEGKAVLRSQAVLNHCKGNREATKRLLERARTGGEVPDASDRIRVLATASSALAQQKRTKDATAALEEALSLASYGPKKTDPAARALAVSGNNLACELEQKEALTDSEKDLMLRAAFAGRKFWEIAGSWTEVERAEYRLALSHLRAGKTALALEHARKCLEIVLANGSEPAEVFFANEALARALAASGDREGARSSREKAAAVVSSVADEDSRDYCKGELAKLDASLGSA
ncbi:hypothetical protein HY251_00260 [bacterium]|nr:hypothetical protein [bacterium]